MAEITADLIKNLRLRTGAGMMDCKRALAEVDSDTEAAIDWLRKKGLANAAKKSGRVASEGLIGVFVTDCASGKGGGSNGAIVEINSETDFVARNETFQNLVLKTAEIAAMENHNLDSLKTAPFPGENSLLEQEITRLIGVIGENLSLRRVDCLGVSEGQVSSYIHNSVSPGLGKIGVLVALESSGNKEKLAALGKQIAMHIAAASPQALTVGDLDKQVINRERSIVQEQAQSTGRSEEIIEKMIEGRLRKFYEDVVLMEQVYIMDGKIKIRDMIENAAKDINTPVILKGFIRYAVGEGIEKAETDFAAAVQAQAGLSS
jgi:elongation factor Ts